MKIVQVELPDHVEADDGISDPLAIIKMNGFVPGKELNQVQPDDL